MSQRQFAAPQWLAGSTRLWLFDLGSASFLGAGAMGLIMAIVLSFIEQQSAVITLLLGMFLVSVCAAIAWQFNRLAATEWATLVPQYRRNVVWQAAILLAASLSLSVIFLAVNGLIEQVDQLLLITVLGLLFIYLCLVKVAAFYLSFILYLVSPFAENITAYLPAGGSLILVIALLIMVVIVWQKVSKLSWHHDARNVYLNGLEMGWFWLPAAQSFSVFNRIERYLHPANYFIGPMLITLLVAMPVVTLVLALGAYTLDVQLPVLFLLVQFNSIACAMLHWSRIQRWRAVESLFVLPGFDGKQGMIDAFMLAQYRLLVILTVSMMLTAALVSLLSPLVSFSVWLHIVLSNVFGCALILGLGSMCRTSAQISATIFLVALQSGWVSSSLSTVQNGGDIWSWIAWDVPLLILAFTGLWYAKYRLWRGDLLSS
ncbi:hypothetical protein L2755_20070 [Shewanella abyssi]|uniref:hypothetical protein n=1 Tax=Shewanella abyssi TaxID=311789 RepID=UPI00200C57E1|nr:hypothetical protein [Shewanella abyssi]MCL1051904.1 hypothetical protein [Shewanella abyssi]